MFSLTVEGGGPYKNIDILLLYICYSRITAYIVAGKSMLLMHDISLTDFNTVIK